MKNKLLKLLTGKVLLALIMIINTGLAIKTLAQRRPLNRTRNVNPPAVRQRPATMQGNRPINSGNRSINSGNHTNINNINTGNKNVNINVNNTVVRNNVYRPYNRPPYVYGGRRYYSYHPYFYHPYRPAYWGPVYHPWGFFVAALATTAIIVSVANQQYHYDQGMYYKASNSGYTVVQAPVGAVVTTIPNNAQTVVVSGTTNNYYYAGTFYEKSGKGYTVVPPTAGSIVESLPEGGKEVKVGDVNYVKLGETYYQPIQQDGKNVYEVVKVDNVS